MYKFFLTVNQRTNWIVTQEMRCSKWSLQERLLLTWLTLIPAWVNDNIHYKLSHEITNPLVQPLKFGNR